MEVDVWPPKYFIQQHMIESLKFFREPGWGLGLFLQVKDGFFIEAGADDFETDSNTLLFELQHNWTGILVEPNPTIFPKGFSKQRKVSFYPTIRMSKPMFENLCRRLHTVKLTLVGLRPRMEKVCETHLKKIRKVKILICL